MDLDVKNVNTLKLFELKDALSKLGLSEEGNKHDLIERLKSAIEKSHDDDLDVSGDSEVTIIDSKITSNNPSKSRQNSTVFRLLRYIKHLENKVQQMEVRLTKTIKRYARRTLLQSPKNIRSCLRNEKSGPRSKRFYQPGQDDRECDTGKEGQPSDVNKVLENSLNCGAPVADAFSTSSPGVRSAGGLRPSVEDHLQGDQKQPRVLLLADGRGRGVASSMARTFCGKYKTQVIFKPNALLSDVIANSSNLTGDFTLSDWVIFLGGTEDVSKSQCLNANGFRNVVNSLTHTNVLVLTVPFSGKNNQYAYNYMLLCIIVGHNVVVCKVYTILI